MEAADGVHGIDLLNLQLGLVDRDFDESDYEVSNLTHAVDESYLVVASALMAVSCAMQQQRMQPSCLLVSSLQSP